ncbi:MAG: hypothetical protein AMXMBFR33_68570 [Candidatus Xenobia bacterium]|jgi:uncharacterized membrane protein YfcA
MVLAIVMLSLAVGFLGWAVGDASLPPDQRAKLLGTGAVFLALGLLFLLRRFRGPRPDREERRRLRDERRGR